MKTMKKLISTLLALVMCLSLAACGADKQPAIDAFNEAKAAFNEVAAVINEDPAAYDQEVIDTMKEMSNLLQQHGELLSSDKDIEEEKLNEMIEWYGTVKEWVADMKAELDIK